VTPTQQELSPELQDLLQHFLRKAPTDRITLGDALDHPWSQLADADTGDAFALSDSPGKGGEASDEASAVPPSPGLRGTLRSRAYSFQRVHVTQDEVQGAIRSVNNFVLVVRGEEDLPVCWMHWSIVGQSWPYVLSLT
jgi:serine/threonine protein kinase